MTSMPVFDDRTVDLFRRTGKRRAAFRSGRAAARVVPQRSGGCRHVNDTCRGPNGAIGVCDINLDCVMDIGDGRLPQF
jgi:hypothetical protein